MENTEERQAEKQRWLEDYDRRNEILLREYNARKGSKPAVPISSP